MKDVLCLHCNRIECRVGCPEKCRCLHFRSSHHEFGGCIACDCRQFASTKPCEVHLEKNGQLRVTAWVRPDQMYATLSALQSTPELRERIARVLYAQDSDAGPVFYAQEYADIVDAVLDVVTAHMAVNESDIVATNHVFGCERRENALRVALEAFVARKLKAETP